MSMLIPTSARMENIFEGTSGWLAMPAPTTEIRAISVSKVTPWASMSRATFRQMRIASPRNALWTRKAMSFTSPRMTL